jgi:hypothetical protein
MNFTDNYHLLRKLWNDSTNPGVSPAGTEIHRVKFVSGNSEKNLINNYLRDFRDTIPGAKADEEIFQNREFTYPVFTPSGINKNSGAILLLHGLNERKWDKYLCWADYLASATGKSVILFPISFHLNRSLPEWTDRRVMMERVKERQLKYREKNDVTTFINEALSERLTDLPERFFLSGLQTSNDLVTLLEDIYEGRHPHFSRGTHSDIFAYSIGGLLAQVLFIANPKELFSDSKLFLFCAGSLFHEMNGVSKLIMDPVAYHKIYRYYLEELETEISNHGVFSEFFRNNKIGIAFRSMLAPDRLQTIREGIFRSRKKSIYAISLKNDRVIPTRGISKALLGTADRIPSNMEVMDFNFPSYHEMPFPVKNENIKKSVDQAFNTVFSKAATFLA